MLVAQSGDEAEGSIRNLETGPEAKDPPGQLAVDVRRHYFGPRREVLCENRPVRTDGLHEDPELAAEARVQYVPGGSFFPTGGGEEFIRLAYSYESPEKCYEGGKLLAQAIRGAMS